MELLKQKFISTRDALIMGDKPLNEVLERYSIKRLNAALAAYKETHSWDSLVALMAKCKRPPRFSSYGEPYAKMHLMHLGLARTEAEAKKIYLQFDNFSADFKEEDSEVYRWSVEDPIKTEFERIQMAVHNNDIPTLFAITCQGQTTFHDLKAVYEEFPSFEKLIDNTKKIAEKNKLEALKFLYHTGLFPGLGETKQWMDKNIFI